MDIVFLPVVGKYLPHFLLLPRSRIVCHVLHIQPEGSNLNDNSKLTMLLDVSLLLQHVSIPDYVSIIMSMLDLHVSHLRWRLQSVPWQGRKSEWQVSEKFHVRIALLSVPESSKAISIYPHNYRPLCTAPLLLALAWYCIQLDVL